MKIARAALAGLLISGAVSVGCNRVQLKEFVGLDGGSDPGCSVVPHIPCDAVEPSPDSCSGGKTDTGNGAALPTDASFPVGCQAYFRGKDCSSRGFCTCDAPDDAGTPAVWNCHDVDGGT
ncbi:MAG: hypothetical protein ABI461_17690 [Polyangiaceae bacterium]